jgi:hypothetical protein
LQAGVNCYEHRVEIRLISEACFGQRHIRRLAAHQGDAIGRDRKPSFNLYRAVPSFFPRAECGVQLVLGKTPDAVFHRQEQICY